MDDQLEYESAPDLPAHEQVRGMARDLNNNMSTNHAETWCHILYRLMMHTRTGVLFQLVCGTYELMWQFPYKISEDELYQEVDLDNAYLLGLSSHDMPLESTLTLHSILEAAEQELGSDHIDMQPVHRVRRGLRERAKLLAKGIDMEDVVI